MYAGEPIGDIKFQFTLDNVVFAFSFLVSIATFYRKSTFSTEFE